MKKIFSIVLATALLVGMLLPMAVSAADPAVISATGTSVIEIENYKAEFVPPAGFSGMNGNYKASPNASGTGNNTLLFWSSWTSTTATADFTVPVTVAEAGTYTMTVVGSTTCPLTLTVDGRTYEPFASYNLDPNSPSSNEQTTHNNVSYPGKEYMFNVELSTTTTAITVNMHKNPSVNEIATGLDCIRVRNAKAVINSKGAETTIQVEDYAAARYIGTDASGGLRAASTEGSTTAVTTGNAVALSGANRAFMVNKVSSNTYPFNVGANRIMYNVAVGGTAHNGIALKKWNSASKAWEDYSVTQEDKTTYTGYDGQSQNNPAFDGYMAVKIPVAVQKAGTYQLDILCLDPSFGDTYSASPIEIYRGDAVVAANQIGIVNRSSANKVLIDSAKDANGAFPYMYRNANIKGYTDAPIARFTFSAQLSTADEYITLAIKTRAKYSPAGKVAASLGHEITQYIDSITLKRTDMPTPTAISATGTSVIEIENYKAEFVPPAGFSGMNGNYKSSPNASGTGNNTLLFWSSWTSTTATADFTVPVTVAEAGTYTMTVVGSTTCPLTLTVDGTTYQPYASYNLDPSSPSSNEQTTHNNVDYPGKEYMFNVDLSTTTEEITVNMHKNPSSNQIATGLDCIRVRNAKAIISSDAVTTIEVEDFGAARYIGTDASGGLRSSVGSTAAMTTGGAVAFGGAKRAFMVNGASSNMYPFNVTANRIAYNVSVGGTSYSGTDLKKWNASTKTWEAYAVTQEDKTAYQTYEGKTHQAAPFDGYMAVKIPVAVAQAGTYQLDILCLDPSFGGTYSASPIEIYRGDVVDASKRIGIVNSSANKVLFESEKDANGAFPYMYRNANIKGFTSAPIARFAFSATLDTTDEYITLAIKTRAKYSDGTTVLPSAAHEITQYIDSVTITGANVATSAISKSAKAGTVVYGANERAMGKAILALYNDDTLVAVEKWDATMGEAILNFTTTYAGEYDAAKVFIWEDLDNCVPKVVAKDLRIDN